MMYEDTGHWKNFPFYYNQVESHWSYLKREKSQSEYFTSIIFTMVWRLACNEKTRVNGERPFSGVIKSKRVIQVS